MALVLSMVLLLVLEFLASPVLGLALMLVALVLVAFVLVVLVLTGDSSTMILRARDVIGRC